MPSNELAWAWIEQYGDESAQAAARRFFAGPGGSDAEGSAAAARVRNYSPPPITTINHDMENEIRTEAYFMWERLGRPVLSKQQQDAMYFEAEKTVHSRHREE